MLCITAGGKVLAFAASTFTLTWTHSVQRTEWWERWEVSTEGLRPVEARVSGSGAGIEPPPDATWQKDGWHYRPTLPSQREIFLGASGATGGGWILCAEGTCQILGSEIENPLRLWTAPTCEH